MAAAAAKLFLTSSPGFGCAKRGGSRHKAGAVLVRSLKLRHAEGKNVMIIISVSPQQVFTAFAISSSSSSAGRVFRFGTI